jgi:phosphatidylglycerol:prolipoprotein diacylglycerol transferase
MRPYLADLLNRRFHTEVFTYLLPNYMIMLCLGAFLGTLWAARRARRRGLNPEILYGLILWAFPLGILGGRLAHWLYAPEVYRGSLLALLDPLQGDSMAYGGLIGGSITAGAYLWLRGEGVWRYLDCAGPALGVATAFTRVGCFMNGCCYGCVTSSPLALQFPSGSPAFLAQVGAGLLSPSAAHSLPVHPTQVYQVLKGLLLAVLVALYGRSGRAAPGEEFCLFWILYAAARFGLELLRGDPSRGWVGPLSTSQAVSIPVFLLANLGYWRCRSRRLKAA